MRVMTRDKFGRACVTIKPPFRVQDVDMLPHPLMGGALDKGIVASIDADGAEVIIGEIWAGGVEIHKRGATPLDSPAIAEKIVRILNAHWED